MNVLSGIANETIRLSSAGENRARCVQKRSRQRDAIMNVLRNTSCHPTATWIYDEVRKEIPNISLGTIYRNLRRLGQRGEISELEIGGSGKRYDAVITHHYHFQCDLCGQIFDIDDSAADWLNLEIARETGFHISKYQIEFHGLCRRCRRD